MVAKIGVHNGIFHTDDVCATAILSTLHRMNGDVVKIIRSRDPQTLAGVDYLVDVGCEYNHEEKKYDHHHTQAPFRPCGTPYAAVGLVWLHYGQELLNLLDPDHPQNFHLHTEIDLVFREVDSMDNGSSTPLSSSLIKDITAFYPFYGEQRNEEIQFSQAVSAFGDILLESIRLWKLQPSNYAGCLQRGLDTNPAVRERRTAREIYHQKAIIQAHKELQNASGGVCHLSHQALPWREVAPDYPHVDFICFRSSNGVFYAQSSYPTRDSLIPKKNFPAEWAALEGEALEQASGVVGAKFCHKNRFIIGAYSITALTQMIEKTMLLDIEDPTNHE